MDASLVGGAATITAELPTGVHLLSATYHGDGNFTGSTGTETQTVNQASTTTTVTSAPDPSRFGQPVTVTVTVAPVAPGAGTPTGFVTVTVDGLGAVDLPLVGGTATLTTSALAVGSHDITAVYGGDANFTGSFGTATQTVQRALTSTAVTSAPDPSGFGDTVTITATVTAVPAGTPTGTVTFTVDGPGGFTRTVPVGSGGTAVVTTSTLGAGTHTITADYSGDTGFTPSSGTDTQTVGKAATTTSVTSSPDPSAFGEPVTLTATVARATSGTGTPTGTVTFTITGGPTLTATLDANGVATATTDTLGVGSHTITATYGGDADFASSTGTTSHTVGTPTSATTVTARVVGLALAGAAGLWQAASASAPASRIRVVPRLIASRLMAQ